MKKIRINTEEFLKGEDKMFFAFFFCPERNPRICWRHPHFMDERRERNQE